MTSKCALIIGGSRGIGFSVAKKFKSHGFNVIIMSRNKENLNKSVYDLQQLSPENESANPVAVSGHVCDISKEESIQNAFKSIIHTNVHVLVNAAAVNYDNLLMRVSTKEMDSVIDTNLKGTILSSKYILKSMIRHKNGAIVNIGSIIGINGNFGQTIYSASKSGLIGFTKSLAKEVASKGITVNLIAPGFVRTDMTSNISHPQLESIIPLQRVASPSEIADAVYFIANAKYITGEVLLVDGGMHLMF